MHTKTTESRSRSRVWLAGVAALCTAGLLGACGPAVVAPAAYVGVCVDPVTHLRVPDALCGGADPSTGAALGHAGYLWDYYPPSYGGVIAAYHQPVVGVAIVHVVPVTTSTHVVVIDRGASSSGGPATSVRPPRSGHLGPGRGRGLAQPGHRAATDDPRRHN